MADDDVTVTPTPVEVVYERAADVFTVCPNCGHGHPARPANCEVCNLDLEGVA